jgi:membrane-bound lytic murein transglycosylase MltF
MMTLGDLLGQMLDMKLGMSDNNELLRAGVSMLKDMIEHMQESLSEREHESEENDE